MRVRSLHRVRLATALGGALILGGVAFAVQESIQIGKRGCYTLEVGNNCGTDLVGPIITCEDQTQGPSLIRTASSTHVCRATTSAGNDRCQLAQDQVAGYEQWGSCVGNPSSYQLSDEQAYVWCHTHELTGMVCNMPDPDPNEIDP